MGTASLMVAMIQRHIQKVNQPDTQADIIYYKTKHAKEIVKVLGSSEERKSLTL